MKETAEARSKIMRAVKSRDTAPELLVRRLAHDMGYRFRLHYNNLPGKPDLVFPRRKKAIFVHGCFWHGHSCARGARVPKANRTYWLDKIDRNRMRDRDSCAALTRLGWKVRILWECRLKSQKMLRHQLRRFLGLR